MVVTSPVVDVRFALQGSTVPVDHGYALYAAISRIVETPDNQWLHAASDVALVHIRGRHIGEGKLSIEGGSRFGIRLPGEKLPWVLPLTGKQLELNGCQLTIGIPTTSMLRPAASLYAHTVTTKNGNDEGRFRQEVARQLGELGIADRLEIGRRHTVRIRDKQVVGYSVFLTGLTADESLRLQERGLGGRRKMGCGVFTPVGRAQA